MLDSMRSVRLPSAKPDVSVIVVVYNMAREASRTLLSLSASYQRYIKADEYEVIVVDNGSDPPLDPKLFAELKGNFRLIRIDNASPSPAQAVNRGIAEARGDIICVMIDGARIITPGLLHFARHGARLHDHAVVAALGWYLGYDFQRWAIQCGYDQAREDALLAEIGWPQNGYRLFDIATLDESSVEGWFHPISEANALFMRRESWDRIGGMDERFVSPGGGLVNLDTYSRALELPHARLVLLLGEGTFHQVHGGVATNLRPDLMQEKWVQWASEYERLRGQPYASPKISSPPAYIGPLPRPALLHFVHAAVAPVRRHSELSLGVDFDPELWSLHAPAPAKDPIIAALIELAHRELKIGRYPAATSIARLARSRAPDEYEPQRLLSITATGADQAYPLEAEHFLAIGEAYRLLGERERAAANYRKALTFDYDLEQAHRGLATLALPGDGYDVWLDRFYNELAPETVIEISSDFDALLALVRPPALAIGVGSHPNIKRPLKAETHIFPETSDAFFSRHGPDSYLAGRALGIGFIDGLHLYEQALRDFINLERYCGPRSVILLHDTVPLDEATQSRARDTQFYTGDVWKTVLCLKYYRPDLEVFTIATPWTGLTVVAGLDPTSRVLSENYDEAVARFIDTPFSAIELDLGVALNIVPNEWKPVESRLKARGIL
jgi:tetratricopeptide (TPR) repeat protein